MSLGDSDDLLLELSICELQLFLHQCGGREWRDHRIGWGHDWEPGDARLGRLVRLGILRPVEGFSYRGASCHQGSHEPTPRFASLIQAAKELLPALEALGGIPHGRDR